jgi:hypothetical protein
MIHGAVEDGPIVAEDPDRKDRIDDRRVPVAVGFGEEVVQKRIVNGHHHTLELFDVGRRPSRIGGPEYFSGVAEHAPRPTGQQFGVVPFEVPQRSRPGSDHLDGLVRMFLVPGHVPLERVTIGRVRACGQLPVAAAGAPERSACDVDHGLGLKRKRRVWLP